MNFLFHLYLSGNDPEIMTGNLMGDFVKGRIGTEYPPGIRTGLVLHRRIDSFAQENETFRRSRNRLGADYGLWRGVLVDLFYDHFLARDWTRHAEVSLGEYLREAGREVAARSRVLPGRMRSVLPMLFGEWLPSYGEIYGIAGVLERMGRRVVRDNPLAGGERELLANYGDLEQDFLLFLPQVQEFAAEEIRRITRDR